MNKRKLLAAAAAVVAGALAFSACTPQPSGGQTAQVNTASTTTVMWNQPFFSYNNATSFGNATANTNPIYLTNDGVTYYDDQLNLVNNKSFGTYEKLSDDPLTVKITLADTATWSDGVPVTAADIILLYGGQSGLFNTVTDDEEISGLQNEDGSLKEVEEGKVYFDGGSPSAALITEFPEVGDNNKSVTYTYSRTYADWEKDLLQTNSTPGVPAHVVAKRALGTTDPAQGQQAIIDAFKNKDAAALSKIANVWNNDFNYKSMPTEAELVVGSGPYTISDLKDGEYITFSKNPNYKGERQVKLDTLTIRFNEDPMAAVQALQNGEVQLIQPQATADVLTALQGLDGVTVTTGDGGTYEHVDLTFNNGGPFDPATYGGDEAKALLVRQAFLHTIPRQAIIDRIIKPLNPNAVIRNSWELLPTEPNYPTAVAQNGVEATYGGGGNVDKAKELLAQAGVTGPTVRVLYGQGNQRRTQQFQLIKESAEQAGFVVVDNASPDWGQKLGDKTYDAALFGWQTTSTAVSDGDANYRSASESQPAGLNNYGGFVSQRVNELYDELQGTTDEARQLEILIEVEKVLVEQGFGVPIFQHPSITAYSDRLQGVKDISISPTMFWNFWEWEVAAG